MSFDPYHKWLGIRPEHQPPDYYRLLGIARFENDSDVIESAADQRMAHLRGFQSGQNAQFSQKLLNEIAAARVCLMNPNKRAAYDQQLAAMTSAEHSSLPTATVIEPAEQSVFEEPSSPRPMIGPVAPQSALPGQRSSKAAKPPWLLPAAIGGAAIVVMAIVVVALILLNQQGSDGEQAADSANSNSDDGRRDKGTDPANNDGQSQGTAQLAPALTKYVPADAFAAVVVNLNRAASSEVGQALIELDLVQAGLQQSEIKPADIERIIYAMGIPTDKSENDCTIVQFTKPMPREALLEEEFADLPYEEVQFQGATYYRYADEFAIDESDVPLEAPHREDLKATPAEPPTVLAKYPDDHQPNANGHVDSSDSGNWFYYSSFKDNPTLSDANLRQLNWAGDRNRYESPRGAMGNQYPAIGGSLDPSPRPPQFVVLRWQSRTSAEVRIRGTFSKFDNAKVSNGVRVIVWVDGQQKFSADVRPTDTVGVEFDVAAEVVPGSVVDFVVDPKGNASYDSTKLIATIERALPKVLAKYPDDHQPNANGHADSSDSGNWNYYSSDKQNPALLDAQLAKLTWNPQQVRYEGNDFAANRMWPAIGGSLHPGFKGPPFAVLRWQSRTSAQLAIRGKFHALPDAKSGDGVRVLVFVDGRQEFSMDLKRGDTAGVTFDVSASIKPGSTVDFVVDPKEDSGYDSTVLQVTIERHAGNAPTQPAIVEIPAKPSDGIEEPATLFGTAIYFPDDKTLVTTNEHQLRSLLSGPPAQTPLTKKLSQLDLDHDLVAVVAVEGVQNQLAGLLMALSEEMESAELGGLSVLPQHADFAVATLDLSGDTLLNVTVDARNEQSADEVEGGLEYLLDMVEGLRHVIPEQSPLLPLLKQVVMGTTLQTNGSQVVLKTRMPADLADFVNQHAEGAIASLGETTMASRDHLPRYATDSPSKNVEPDEPRDIVARKPPKDHPELRDLAVKSRDCRVFFPGDPELTEDSLPIEEGTIHITNFWGRTARASYMFEVDTYPEAAVAKKGAKVLLDETRDTMIDAPTGRVISSKPITYQDSPAIDFIYEHPDVTASGQGHCRIVIRENRVFVLEVLGESVPPEDIRIFFDSLAPFALSDSTAGDSDQPIVAEPRLPVPEEAARETALQLVRQVYETEFQSAKTAAEKIALAETMISHAGEIKTPADRFVLLDVARKMAAGAGGVDAALEAIGQLDDEYEVDALQFTAEALVDLATAAILPDNRIRVTREMLDAAQMAVEADRYEIAVGLLEQAAASARSAREFKLAKTATDQIAETNQLKSEYESIQPSLEKLKDDADEAAANEALVGRFYCLTKGQWDTGLPHLAKGSDQQLTSIAEQDLAGPQSAEQQTKLADAWFELAAAAEELAEKHLQLRAAHWYRQALPTLTALEKATVEKRLAAMKHVAAAAGPKLVFLPDVPMFGAEGILINDNKGHFREERLRGETYPQVLWAHPQDKVPSHYAFTLNRKFSQLTGKAAINDVQSVARAQKPQVFAIYGDKRLLWTSRPLQDKLDSQEFTLNVSNIRTLHLYVTGGGFGGHALWVDVVLEEKP